MARLLYDPTTGRWIDTRTGELLPGRVVRPEGRSTFARLLWGEPVRGPGLRRPLPPGPLAQLCANVAAWSIVSAAAALLYLVFYLGGCLS